MKKTLSILAVAVLAVGSTMTTVAKDVVIEASSSNSMGTAESLLAMQATLIDTATGGIVIYDEADDLDEIEAPFNVTNGYFASSITLDVDLSKLEIQEGDRLVIDFTKVGGYSVAYQNWGYYLTSGNDTDYLMINMKGFAEWYENNGPVSIAGRFKTDGSYIETTAFYVDWACNTTDALSSQGNFLFFNDDVIKNVKNAELPPSSPAVPEPTTATLSLLALAGLAARRRRR